MDSIDLKNKISGISELGIGDFSDQNSITELQATLREARALEKDLRTVKDWFDIELSDRVETVYCLDNDVIRSAIEWKENSSKNSFWAALCLQLNNFKLMILPGTLFELSNYISKGKRTAYQNFNNPFYNYFRSLQVEIGDESSIAFSNSLFFNALTELVDFRSRSDALYVLNKIKLKLGDKELHDFPDVDERIINYCIKELSKGKRIDRSYNNKVDAVNYSVCYALNENSKQTGKRYLLISDTRAVLNLDNLLGNSIKINTPENYFENGFVRTSKFAAIQCLIRKMGISINRSIAICYELLNDVAEQVNEITWLIEQKQNKKPKISIKNGLIETSHSPVINLFSSINKIQSLIDYSKQTEEKLRLYWYKHEYLEKNPLVFYQGMEKVFTNLLASKQILQMVERIQMPSGTNFTIEVTGNTEKRRFEEQRILKDEFNSVIAIGRYYTGEIQIIIPQACNLYMFVDIYNDLVDSISAAFATGKYNYEIWKPSEDTLEIANLVPTEQDSRRKLSDIKIYHKSNRPKLKLQGICETTGVAAADIKILGLDNSVFGMAHEGEEIIFNTNFEINDEIQMFFEKLVFSRHSALPEKSLYENFTNHPKCLLSDAKLNIPSVNR